jgi:predicted nucleotidyltransferase
MEYTRNKLSPEINTFFKKLKKYLDTQLYFYGSVQRLDYFPGKSDIDVNIYTDNIQTLNNKLQNYLHLNKNEIKKVMIYCVYSKKAVYGYKFNYKINDTKLEFTIFNNKYKKYLLNDQNIVNNFPFYIIFLLVILKLLYYYLGVISKKTFHKYKNTIINTTLGENISKTIVYLTPEYVVN